MARPRRIPAGAGDEAPLLTPKEWARVVRVLRLTPQQSHVVRLILDGKRDKQIAAALDLSIWTVRTHLTRVFRQVSVGDKVELLLKVFRVVREGVRKDRKD